MADQNPNRFSSPKAIIIAAISILAMGTLGAWFAYNSLNKAIDPSQPNDPVVIEPVDPADPPIEIPDNTQQVQLYWLDENLEITSQTTELPETEDQETFLTNTFDALLQGPDSTNNYTAIPEDTRLLSLNVDQEGIHVNLSSEFTSGGGSASMIGRLGQVIYTATSLESNKAVWISVDGEPLEVLGGEGLIVDQPMTRESYMLNFTF